MRRALILVALVGCTQYAHKATHNAPPIVNLDAPPPRETGDPNAFTPGEQPGTETLAVFVMPNILIGTGRWNNGKAIGETGMSVRFERVVDNGARYLNDSTFAVTVGTAFVQFTENRPTVYGGTFVELNYRFLMGVVPADVGMGVAVYPGASAPAIGEDLSAAIGGQLSVRLPLFQLRARYMTETGFEIVAGYELPIPFFFRRSR